MSKFDKDLAKATKKIEKALEQTVRGASIEMFGEIVRRTPVITGRLRGNWQAQTKSPDLSTVDTVGETEGSIISREASTVNSFKLSDETLWFSNNLAYAEAMETGSSVQRPSGFMRVTVKQFQSLIEKRARKHKV